MGKKYNHPKGCRGCGYFIGREPRWCMLILERRAKNCPCLKCLVKGVCKNKCKRRMLYYQQRNDMEIPIDEC
jgi:hypothetical protein